MIRRTVLPCRLEMTFEDLTAYGGLSILSEFNESLGLAHLVDSHLPGPGSHRGMRASVFVNALILMFQGGGTRLEVLRVLSRESALRGLLGHDRLPHPSTMGGWLRPMDDPSRGASGHGLDRFRTLLNQRLLSQERRLDYTWDVDATHDPSHNKTALYSDHKEKGYYPMLRIPYETPLSLR